MAAIMSDQEIEPILNAQERQLCIFCGAPADSREHVWPDWIKNYLPRTFSHRDHTIHSRATNFKKVTTRKPGDPRSGRLNVTCIKCNTGWISVVDENAKKLMLALMDGRWGNFSPWDRRVFAAWATRFAMVYEFADPDTVTATAEERDYFRLSRYPPDGWYVFVGFYGGTKWLSQWNHRAAANLNIAGAIPDKPNIQSTVAAIGRLIFNVVSGPTDMDMNEYARGLGFQTVWPERLPTFGAPANVFDDAEVDFIASFFGGAPPGT
jgi:hypothetical protein